MLVNIGQYMTTEVPEPDVKELGGICDREYLVPWWS